MSRAARSALPALLLAALTLSGRGVPAAVDARDLYGEPVLRSVQISPSGERLALLVRRGGWDRVVLRQRDDPQEFEAFSQLTGLRSITWIDDEHLAVSVGLFRDRSHRILRISRDGDRLRARLHRIRMSGEIVQLLHGRRGELLWSVPGFPVSRVYRLEVGALLGATREELEAESAAREAASLEARVDLWIADTSGVPRAALVVDGPYSAKLWYRASAQAEWEMILEGDDVEHFPFPLGVADGDDTLVVSASLGEEPRALYELDPATGELGEALFAHPDADVTGVVFDETGSRITGAVYERDGLEMTEHFDPADDRLQRSLEAVFPDRAVALIGASVDRRHLVVLVRGPRHPGTFYTLDTDSDEAHEVGRIMPWLDPAELAEVVPIEVETRDALEVQAFFARPRRPRRPGRPPLLVLPHGGPWAVRDTRHFDPWVQYLATGGLAVLQVNYRGSAGRGPAFLDAGKRQWGTGIEDDIEAAIDRVIELGWADPDRICIAGASYGGYSALISAIRNPERFRCAVSLNGPTDLPFLYHSNPYLKNTNSGREYFLDYVGDPENGVKELKRISPVYRAEELHVPVMLVQGELDPRVDVDHYHRLRTLLDVLGRPHEGYVIPKGHHGLTGVQWVEFVGRMRRFVLRHVGER